MTPGPFPKQLLRVGGLVREGPPVYCRQPHRTDAGRLCGGFVGMPAAGASLDAVLPAGGNIPECREGVWMLPCRRCHRAHVFRLDASTLARYREIVDSTPVPGLDSERWSDG